MDKGPNEAPGGRERIVAAAMALLARDGRAAMTTRAVAAAAGIQAPTIYRLFGDMQGLLDAVAERGFERYLAEKTTLRSQRSRDPLGALRKGWDLHVGFGLANPALYLAMYGNPRPGHRSPTAARALDMLHERIDALARAGRLRVDAWRAAEMARAAACGVVFVLLETPDAARDPGLSEATREALIAAIATDAPSPALDGVGPAATTLRALLPDADGLTDGERRLLGEWLDRLARSGKRAARN